MAAQDGTRAKLPDENQKFGMNFRQGAHRL